MLRLEGLQDRGRTERRQRGEDSHLQLTHESVVDVGAHRADDPDLLVAPPVEGVGVGGLTWDEQSTLGATDVAEIEGDLATLVGNIAARSGFDAGPALDTAGISFVLVPEAGPGAAAAARTRAADALEQLASAVGAAEDAAILQDAARPELPSGPLTADGVCTVLGALMPEGAIVSDEGNTSGLFAAG